MKRFFLHLKRQHKGQSFVELAIVFMILLGMFAGVVELGNLLNQYITLVDGAREGARAGANADPFLTTGMDDYNSIFYQNIDSIVEGTYDCDGDDVADNGCNSNSPGNAEITKAAIEPIVLDPNNDDDVVVTAFGITASGDATRFPKFPDPSNDPQVTNNGWSRYGNHESEFTASDFDTLLSGFVAQYGAAPGTGMVVVEIFYHYETILRMPIFLPTTIPVHIYSIMPLTAAEPTPTP